MTTAFDRLRCAQTDWWLRGCETVGQRPSLYGRPTIYGEGRIRIGSDFHLSSMPVASHLVAGLGAFLEIGDVVSIGHGAAIAAYQRVIIGEGTHIGPFVIIMDSNFHSKISGRQIQHECRPVTIGRQCRIESRVTILRGATIRDFTRISAGSVVR